MADKNHARHQRLYQELELINIRIRGHERNMDKKKGKVPSREWEELVRGLKHLTVKKSEIEKRIRSLP